MSQIVINDLPKNVELDRAVMKAVHGGCCLDIDWGDGQLVGFDQKQASTHHYRDEDTLYVLIGSPPPAN